MSESANNVRNDSVFTSLDSPYKKCRTECVGLYFRRDSFSDRVCYDLSEVILQFLPFKDKFRFECVSKQFQKTVYQRQYKLFIDDISQISLKIILKKLVNIRSLKTSTNLQNSDIDLIIKNCNHLTKFKNCLMSLKSETLRDEFISKFGSQLTSIYINEFDFKLNDNLVNIQEIIIDDNYNRDDSVDFYFSPKKVFLFYSQFKPKYLKKLSFYFYIDEKNIDFKDNSKYFNSIIERNKRVTHLSIDIREDLDFKNRFELNLSVISQLNQLISLKLDISEPNHIKSFADFLKLLSINCLKLKSLSLRFGSMDDHFLKKNDFMSEIKRFKQLKRFKFICDSCYWVNDDPVFEPYFIKSFKSGFEKLTHLVFELCYEWITLNDDIIENIVNHLPNLSKLNLQKLKINNKELTEKTVHILSRLSKLQTLKLEVNRYDFPFNQIKAFTDSFKEIMRQKCPKINTISFQF